MAEEQEMVDNRNSNDFGFAPSVITRYNKTYYREDYAEEMCQRWYSKGVSAGRREPVIHKAQIEPPIWCKETTIKKG